MKWRSLLKELPTHGQVVDLHAFHPVQGWEAYHYSLPTIRDFPSHIDCEIAWQDYNGWLFLDKEVTVWRPSENTDPKLMYYFMEQHARTERGRKWEVRFAP